MGETKQPISFKRDRSPPEVIRRAVWLHFRSTLRIRDVEELLAQRGFQARREAVQGDQVRIVDCSQPAKPSVTPTGRWHLDEMVEKIAGQRMYLWRAVDDEDEVYDVLVQKRRNKSAALKLLRKLLQNHGVHPVTITTDKLAPYRAAAREPGLTRRHRPGGRGENNFAENSRLATRRREPKQQTFKSQDSARRILSSHARFYNVFNFQPHLIR